MLPAKKKNRNLLNPKGNFKPFGAGPYTIVRQVTYYSFELDVCGAATDPFSRVFHAILLNLQVNRSN